MPYEFLEEGVTADVTFRASAGDLDALFVAAAEATLNVMIDDVEALRQTETRPVDVEAETLDMLLYRFLGEIIFYKDAEGLLLRPVGLHVTQTPTGRRLRGELRGEAIDRKRHRLAADLKAVTLHGLTVRAGDGGWSASVTLDV